MKKEKKTLNTAEVIERLSRRYSQPEYGFLTQVRNGAGYSASRTMDAMAMSLWPSRGLHITGFEVKVSRGDFLREIRDPRKADELACFCDYWYIVVGDADIVKPGDLPPTWGLIVPSGTGLKVVKEAPKMKAQGVDSSLLAAIMRNMTKGMVPEEAIEARIKSAREHGEESGRNMVERQKEAMEEMKEKIKAFEKASGIDLLNAWRKEEWKDIGTAVNDVRHGKHKKVEKALANLRKKTESIMKYIDGEIDKDWMML